MFKIFDIFHMLKESANDPLKKSINFNGLEIGIEFLKGEKRHPDGPDIQSDYGYVKGTKDPVDGAGTDVYVGTNLEATTVYRVKQLNKKMSLDEYKFMLGFTSADEAAKTYIDSVNIGYFYYGGLDVMSWDEFTKYVESHNIFK